MTVGNLSAKSSNLVILTPVVLTVFSKEDIVVWYLYFTIVSLQLLIDFGFLPTFSRLFSYGYSGLSISQIENIKENKNGGGKPNEESLALIFEATKKVYKILALITFFFATSVGTYLVWNSIQASSNPNSSWIGWFVVITIASFSLYANSYVAFLIGVKKVAFVQRWQMITSLFSVIFSAIVILLTKSLLFGIGCFYIWYLVNFFINLKLFRSNFNIESSKTDAKEVSLFIKSTIWPTAWRSGLGVSFSMGLIQLSAMVVAKLETPLVASSYMIGLQMIRAVSSFSQAPFYAMLPNFTIMYAQSEIDKLLTMAKKRMRISFLIFILMFLLIGLFANDLLTWIGSNAAFPSINLWLLIGTAFFFERYGAMNLQLYTLTNDIIWHIANGVTGILMLVSIFLLYPLLEIYAYPIGMLFAYFIFFVPYVMKKTYYEFKLSFFKQEKDNFVLALFLFVASVIILKIK